MSVLDLQPVIEEAFENRASINSKTVTPQLRKAIDEVIAALDAGVIRVAEKKDGDWVTNQWIKKAVLLSFRIGFSDEINQVLIFVRGNFE